MKSYHEYSLSRSISFSGSNRSFRIVEKIFFILSNSLEDLLVVGSIHNNVDFLPTNLAKIQYDKFCRIDELLVATPLKLESKTRSSSFTQDKNVFINVVVLRVHRASHIVVEYLILRC